MNVQKRNNDVSIYCLSAGATLPEWLGDQAKRNLSKRDESIRRRIELLQDFQMPSCSHRIVQNCSGDSRYVTVAGSYMPRIRCFDVQELSMKFERYLPAECTDMVSLSSDYGKLALLLNNRTVEFHAPYGTHESVRIPTFGRAMAYESTCCELLIAAKGSNVYRINLSEGRFNIPWTMEDEATVGGARSGTSSSSGTSIAVNPLHPLATVGCDDGFVRFWDSRSSSSSSTLPFLKLDIASATAGYGYADSALTSTINPKEITAVAHDPTGLYMSFGTAAGVVALYDVRSSIPLHIQEHKHGLPIHTVRFHPTSGLILSGDEKLIKCWKYRPSSILSSVTGGTNITNVDTQTASEIGAVRVNVESSNGGKFTHFIVAGDEHDPNGYNSGLLLCTTDQPKMDSFYIPAIGVAPKWCSFLDNITEELEERDLLRRRAQQNGLSITDSDNTDQHEETVFENYKFVNREELDQLGISNLIGTPLLRAYMHGFFMDINLYNRVKAVVNPFEYEQYQKQKLKQRLAEKQASRITPRPNKNSNNKQSQTTNNEANFTVNLGLAERLEKKASSNSKKNKKVGQVASTLLEDDRFKSLFTNPDYEIDEEDETFKLRNPSGISAHKYKANNLDSDESEDESVKSQNSADNEERILGDDSDEDDIPIDVDHDDSSDDDDDSDEDGFAGAQVRGEGYKQIKELNQNQRLGSSKTSLKIKKRKPTIIDERGSDDDDDVYHNRSNTVTPLYDISVDDEKLKRRREELNIPLAQRFAVIKSRNNYNEVEGNDVGDKISVRITTSGSKEATFIPKSSSSNDRHQKALRKVTDKTPSQPSGAESHNRRSANSILPRNKLHTRKRSSEGAKS